MRKRNLLIGYRVFFALLGFSAIVTEIATLVARGTFAPSNFFSFFTVEANLLAVVILLMSAVALAHGKQSKFIAILRGANTLYMIVVGVVFSLLLSGIDAEFTAVPWDNTVLHYIMPVAVALDWFMDIPKLRIALKQALAWLVFPVAYVAYSLIRGHYVGWYPYPFLDPNDNGYAGVAITSAALLLGATGLVWALTQFTGRGVAKRA